MSSDDQKIPEQTPALSNFLANAETLRKFCALYEECLDTLKDAFPECKQVVKQLEHLRTCVIGKEDAEKEFIKTWHQQMLQHGRYELCDSHNNQFWKNETCISHFTVIDISSKVSDPGFSNESIQILWEYVDGLNRHSRIYNAIPNGIMNQIQNISVDIMGKVQRGEMKFNMNELNVEEIQNVGKTIISSLNPNDVNELVNNITGLASSIKFDNIQDVFKFVSDIPGFSEHGTMIEQMMQNGFSQHMLQDFGNLMSKK